MTPSPRRDDAATEPASPSAVPAVPRWAGPALVLAMTLAGLAVLWRLPEGARVATHFDAQGRANGWMSAPAACLLMPALALALLGVQALLPRIDPRGDNLRRSARAYGVVWLATLGLLAVVQAIVLMKALDLHVDVTRTVLVATGAMMAAVGNVFGKLRRNYTVGIRTPWTLASERVWDRTHRFGGRCFVAFGALLLVAGLAGAPAAWTVPLVGGGAVLCTLAVSLRSWQFWREEQRAGA